MKHEVRYEVKHEDDLCRALASLRYHHRLRLTQHDTYKDSFLESETLKGIAALKAICNRVAETDGRDTE